MSKKPHIGFIILGIAILGVMFYWYELRPAKIRQECLWFKSTNEAIPAAKDWYSRTSEKGYDFCIKSKGLAR